MRVNLAGFNIPVEAIKDLVSIIRNEKVNYEIDGVLNNDSSLDNVIKSITPEVITAASARVSRNPKPLHELRRNAMTFVDKSRKSNYNIVFGLGHSSVAEHAVFNFDIIGVSRLLIETIENARLAAYTEKSQRYIKIGYDYIIPEEIRNPITVDGSKRRNLTKEFQEHINLLFDFYKSNFDKLLNHNISLGIDVKQANSITKEDLRYILPLATLGQLSMTINARELEYHIKKIKSSELEEGNILGKMLFDIVKNISPSLFKYTEPEAYDLNNGFDYNMFNTMFKDFYENMSEKSKKYDDVTKFEDNKDNIRLAALLFEKSIDDYEISLKKVQSMSHNDKLKLFVEAHSGMKKYNQLRRSIEFDNSLFQIVLSASAYAQLKRHRMSTQIVQPYDISLGVTIPQSIINSGLKGEFEDIIEKTNDFYRLLTNEGYKKVSEYVLTNAHRRRVLVNFDGRSATHFAKERLSKHAQWDIRSIAESIINLEREESPITSLYSIAKENIEDVINKYKSSIEE